MRLHLDDGRPRRLAKPARPKPADRPPTKTPEENLLLLSVLQPASYRGVAQLINWRLEQDWSALSQEERIRAMETFDLRFPPASRAGGERLVGGVR